MAVLVTCHCGRSFHAPDLDAGRITHCPDCGRDLTVPKADIPADDDLRDWEVAPQRTSGKAKASLVLGLVAMASLVGAVFVPILGVLIPVAGISALILSAAGRREIRESKGRLKGLPMCATGRFAAGVACVAIVLVLLLLPAVSSAREAARRSQCVCNLKQLGLAMHNFLAKEGHFPPAAITDPSGKPLLSWRVAILPYLEQESLYRKFKLDEPWDSPHNRPLLAEMPSIFACPSDRESKPSETRYQALTGPETIFEDNQGISINQITDGTSNTLMVVEAKDPVEWTKPDDQPFAPNLPLPALGSQHPGGVNALFADGSTRFLKSTILPGILRSLITRNGGEVIAADSF